MFKTLKTTLSLLASSFMIALIWLFMSDHILHNKFDTLPLNTPKSMVLEELGEPDFIDTGYQDNKSEIWQYYGLLATEYGLVIKDNKIVNKYVSISP